MKKIISIFVLSLLFCTSVHANTLTIKKNREIKTQGDVFYKWPHKWKFSYIMEYWKPYAIQEGNALALICHNKKREDKKNFFIYPSLQAP